MQPRPYQIDIANRAADIIRKHGLVYLAMQVRTGKTATALLTAENLSQKKVLFVTKKKVIDGILADHKALNLSFEIAVTNYEQLHNLQYLPDLIIVDEAHCCILGNTPIGCEKIKDIKVGSSVKSYNFAINKMEDRKVLNVFKNPLTENLIKIKSNGKEIICTESHEIYTKRGWVKAKDITLEDELFIL